jgi:hypothetical protein
MAFPLVSIVIDNFNYARFLAQSIDSALAQTYPRVEVIVVDDASTDGSREIIESYLPHVRAVFQTANRGQGGAFNEGFAASRGEIVMFLDADDWLYPAAVQRIVSAWVPGQSKTHFRLHLVDAAGALIDVHPAPEVRLDRGEVVPLLLELGRYETVVTSGNAFARAALECNLPMPEEQFRIAADGYLATVVPFHGPVVCIEDCLGAYRMHGANAYANARAPASDELCVRTRKFLAHDAHKEPVLKAKVLAAGLELAGDPQLRDPVHLELRLASLRLDPAGHPYPADRRLNLALLGVAASRRARLSWRRRSVIALWFLVAALLPRRIALPAIRWKMQPTARPGGVDRHIKRLRRLLS